MAKCPICNSRKGKRKCIISNDFICSLCCGEIRKEESCLNCSFYQRPRRKYNEVPAYSTSEMDGNLELESYGNTIEGALCAFDMDNDERVKDADAIRIIELLMDKYHFKDDNEVNEKQLIKEGFVYLNEVVVDDLSDIENDVLVKILGVIWFVAKRRTKAGREYMNIVHQYVGPRIGSGIRLLRK